jgi:hypothetical protein
MVNLQGTGLNLHSLFLFFERNAFPVSKYVSKHFVIATFKMDPKLGSILLELFVVSFMN